MEYESARGLSLPVVGLGTMRLMADVCRDIVDAALSEGYRHIDTARKYGNEEEVGAAIRRSSVPREDVILTTKISHTELAGPDVHRAAESSLRRLDTDYVDLLLVHWPSKTVPLEETMAALSDLREQGKTRYIGVANFPTGMFEQVAGIDGLVGNQIEYHPYLAQERLLSLLRARDLIATAYCPLGRSGDLLTDPLLTEIAKGHGRTVAQIALRWLMQQDAVVAIPRTSDVQHLRDNLEIFDFSLSEDEMTAITALDRGARIVDPPHAPDWDEP